MGRPAGAQNKTTTALKEAILSAAAEHGEDDMGSDGLKGYLRKVAREDVKAFTSLLGRVLPHDMTNNGGAFTFPGEIILRAADGNSDN
jgi:hypothetical protein